MATAFLFISATFLVFIIPAGKLDFQFSFMRKLELMCSRFSFKGKTAALISELFLDKF